MEQIIKESIWNQFGAAIDMLENAIAACPDAHWDTTTRFWYNGYHCLFFMDYYTTMKPESFVPPAPFDFSEFEDRMPVRTYTKEELISYLHYCRTKLFELVNDLTAENMNQRWINVSKTMDYSVIEILLYNMRHVQHHAAQLNLLLRQSIKDAPDWVSQADSYKQSDRPL